ncbi:hypothetical protein [Beggiatoa leptomitoformis]|uniref:Uncharacterized protein n=1 Tax=Beggiatoa leptomitoformis TaxID=288004 RepID=A0A2N9YJQ5_9GAMM|nr:hypothetical protein [Beggiatoa leptomitoformis]ALG69306.2 hypothetical protein AL038_03420 [Beggiatoa leptomitoformis]AUI70506.2 hypothetical protein BLE401_02610 [Beggiatoa leptomitoformis]
MMSEEVEKRLKQVRILGEAIRASMCNELHKMGFKDADTLVGRFDMAHFELSRDPYDGQESLKGTWRNGKGHSVGSILFYPDGAFYAEYDIVRPHPSQEKWFVEAVTAWGRGDQVKTEPRLLPSLTD